MEQMSERLHVNYKYNETYVTNLDVSARPLTRKEYHFCRKALNHPPPPQKNDKNKKLVYVK